MELNLQRLEIFLAVVDSGSFSGAARRLYMSQPSVSAHIRALESSLGAHLVDRGPSGSVPTPAGHALARHAREVFAVLERAEEEIATAQGTTSKRLRIAGTTTVGAFLLPKVLSRFLQREPEVQAELRVGNAEAVTGWLLNGEVGLALGAGTLPTEQLVSRPVLQDALVLAAPAGHPLAQGEQTPAALTGQRFLMREIGSSTRVDQDLTLREWGLADAATWTVWSAEALKEAVRAGLGIALLSEHVVESDLETGTLSRIEVTPRPRHRQIFLIHKAGRELTGAEIAFGQLLRHLPTWPDPGSFPR